MHVGNYVSRLEGRQHWIDCGRVEITDAARLAGASGSLSDPEATGWDVVVMDRDTGRQWVLRVSKHTTFIVENLALENL